MIFALVLGLAAAADGDLRDLCPDRPGRLTPACIVDAGHLQAETALADFTHDTSGGGVTDTTAGASTLLRYGVTQHLELLAGWTPFVHAHSPGQRAVDSVGDVTLGLKQSLLHPDGKGFSLAVQPFVTLPTAKAAVGVGSTVEGLIVPVTVALPADFALGLSPEVDRVANAGDRGHRASYTMIGGVSRQFGPVNAGVELAGTHDDDPTGRTTKATADLFAAYIPKAHPTVQFDASAYIGLNRDTPAVEVQVGVSHRF
ncbi:MAG: transporter [Sphingomonadaceae bacterium]|nr:transporter [Sphingomonadaceae bacterium]